uniref:Uncharacterized protein n=1 Tax=Desulfobacca acetoxidans TaxID=60893 RepID=A0A7C5EXQ8_9BACT
MGLSNLLHKLGVVRYGAQAGTFTSSKDRPAEFLMEEVLDAQKDLTTKEDVHQVVTGLQNLGFRKVLFWGVLALAALCLLTLAAAGGISLWLLADLALWGGILYVFYRFAFEGRLSPWILSGLVFLGLLLSLIFIGSAASS